MTESPWREKERLRRLYVDEGLSMAEIGDRLGCTGTTISDWLNRYDIDARDPDPPTMEGEDHPRFVTREELIEDYQNLADELGKTPSQEE
ncbi:homing endonuclease associated repeat-containing protein [Halorubrum californiense]|nr:helix-turn-helix domain-containing protein [Halorubrum californiense]